MTNALITGATRGMGRAIAVAFAKQNFNLAVCARNADDLEALRHELQQVNPAVKICAVVTNISKKNEVLAFAGRAEQELGFINLIVNNAGLYHPSTMLDDDEETFDRMVNTNLMPAYTLYRYFGKTMMAARQGHIFNICSSASVIPVVEAGTYSVTKYALLGLNKVMRLEMQQYGVKVTAVIPGSTLTSSWQGTTIPAERFILPDDIASASVNTYGMSAGANVDEITLMPAFGQL